MVVYFLENINTNTVTQKERKKYTNIKTIKFFSYVNETIGNYTHVRHCKKKITHEGTR